MDSSFDDRRYLIPFRSALLSQIFTDVLVVGAGVAGLRAALTAAEHSDVIVLAKGSLEESNTSRAQGGVAAVTEPTDCLDDHVQNTLDAGAGLCDEAAVRRILTAGPDAVRRLMDLGMPFDRDEHGGLRLGREGGHNAHRILHADGDATGRAVGRTLVHAARGAERIRLFDHCFLLDLVTEGGQDGGGRCLGAVTYHPKYGLQMIWARAVIMASGGCGQVYRETTNSPVATGDGMAAAYRAGAALSDLAFMQFHPTTLYVAGATRALITEAVRGEGAYLVDRAGRRFMQDAHELGELAPRDIVARAILQRMSDTHETHVYLDTRHIGRERFAARFPGITELLTRFEIDPGTDLIPVRPAAHYFIGGIRVDDSARTSLPGLYACGEVACTGLHGANRLASNSLLEGLVEGETAGRACEEMARQPAATPFNVVSVIQPSERSDLDVQDVQSSVRSVMWRHVGIQRHGERLAEVGEMFDFWARYTLDKIFDDRSGWEVQNQLLLGALMTRSARWRQESRGVHFRSDCPEPREEFRVHDAWQRGQEEPSMYGGQLGEPAAG
ncbi:MAG: L-aspartate oxidase [Chloroflexota bacterium]